jgi:hypothetical protein
MNGSWSERIGALAGVAFAVCIMMSVMVVDPLREATDGEINDWWAKDANVTSLYTSMYFRLLAVPALLAFLVPLTARLRAAEGEGGWSGYVNNLAVLAAAGLAISAIGRGVLAESINLDGDPVPGVDMLRFVIVDSQGVYSLVGMPAMGILIGVSSAIALRTKAFPAWYGWLGAVVTLISVAMIVLRVGAFATPFFTAWVLAGSFLLFRGARISSSDLSFVEARGSAS